MFPLLEGRQSYPEAVPDLNCLPSRYSYKNAEPLLEKQHVEEGGEDAHQLTSHIQGGRYSNPRSPELAQWLHLHSPPQ